MAYHWPGNVRQLQNVVRSVVVLNDGEFVTPDLLPREILASAGLNLPMARLPIAPPPPACVAQVLDQPTPPVAVISAHAEPPAFVQPTPFVSQQEAPSRPSDVVRALRPLEDTIRETIEQAIEQCGGSIPKAAAALDVSPSTLYRRIQGWESADADSQ
jgi:DNA-binding NtrC family response regulator